MKPYRARNRLVYILIAIFTGISGVAAQDVFDFPPSVPLELHKPLDQESLRLQRTAMLLLSRGESKKALQVYRRLFDKYPEYDPFYDGLIRSLLASQKYQEGQAFVDSLKGTLLKSARPQDLTYSERERLGNLMVDAGQFAGKQTLRE
ncbi:MAG: hypothetical protein ABH878_10050 [bacterium]